MKKVLDIFKKPLWLLCLGLGIVLTASIFANMANTSLQTVSVTEVTFETEREGGQLTGLLYRPRSCTAENPCATIVTTHGFLNTKEMQDAPAIELSRRGYVVLALDQYDHGDSVWDESNGTFMFWLYSQYDAVKYMYDQEYVLKAADGTGMIAVSGHSMGGFSSRMAAFLDSTDGGKQMISAVLAVGADFQWTDTFGMSHETIITLDAAAKRTMGTIGARYDEFFFNADNNKGGTVKEKDWTTTTIGNKFYYAEDYTGDNPEFTSGQWNEESYNGGGSVIYVPNEIHPWNHFSVETTAYMVEFYDRAFETQFEIHNVTENEGVVAYNDGKVQTWWLKEGFECVALAGMFIAIVAAIGLFAGLPFFNKVTTAGEEINEVSTPTGTRSKLMKAFLVVACFTTAYLYPMMRLGTTEAYVEAVRGLMWVSAIILLAAGIAHFVIKAVKGEDEKSNKVLGNVMLGGIALFAASFFSHWTLTAELFTNGQFYNEDYTTIIAYWAFVSAGLTVIALVISHFLSNKKDGYTLANYGLKANWKQVGMALLIAAIVVTGVYVTTFIVELVLRVDFRVWTYAIKPFADRHFVAFLRYVPIFFIFYLVNGVSVIANTGADKTWKGTLKAVLINALPLVLLLGVHYGYDFVTGVAKWPTLALDMILVWALVPTLALAAWIARKSYLKTGNVWTGVFINTLLFTLMQVANTVIYYYS